MVNTWKIVSHFEKWARLGKNSAEPGKTGHTLKNGSHLEKWVTLGKTGHI